MKANKTRKELATEYCKKINSTKSFPKREKLLREFDDKDERTRVFARHRNIKEYKIDVQL